MKKLLFILTVLFSAAGLSAAEAETTCTAKKVNSWTWGQQNLDMAVYVEFSNKHNRHILGFIQWKAGQKSGPKLQSRLYIPGAYGNFFFPIQDFINMTVNGIKMQDISLTPDDVKVWDDPKTGNAGADIPLNFNGTQIILRAYIRPDSGVLFLNFRPDPKSVAPLKDIAVRMANCISGLHLIGDGNAVWDGKKYHRQAISPAHTYEPEGKKRAFDLTPEDTYLLLQDTTLPGKGDDKFRRDRGPSVFIPDPNVPTRFVFGIYCEIHMKPKPDFKEINIGVWQKKQVITNEYLAQYIKDHPGEFQVRPME